MLPTERQQKLLELLTQKKVLKLTEIMEAFDISLETVRRDINLLEKQNKIEKIYGGIKLIEQNMGELAMDHRMAHQLIEKEAMAQKCSSFIREGDCIFIDSGSTTYHIAKYIKTIKNLTVITNSLPVILELLHTDIEVIMIGGKVRHDERSIVAYDYLFNFSQLNISKSFIGAGGISLTNGISDYNMEEAITRKQVIERTKETYVVAHNSKFGKDVTISIAPLSKISGIITDTALPKDFLDSLNMVVPIYLCE